MVGRNFPEADFWVRLRKSQHNIGVTQLRPLGRSHPKIIYGLLMRAAADALQKLANDPATWARATRRSCRPPYVARAMLLHPHVHMPVTAGGLSADGSWVDSKYPRFLVPVEALSVIFLEEKLGCPLQTGRAR